MVTIPLGTSDWASPSEDIPRLRLHNMYLIDNPSSPDGISRVSRPTVNEHVTLGQGPIYGFWRQDGTLNGDSFVVSGNELYRLPASGVALLLGNVPATTCQFAGSTNRVIVVSNGVAYSTDGSGLTTVAMPNGESVGSVACFNDYFLLSVKDSQVFYWIVPGGVNPEPLDFASAERTPDGIVSINTTSDEIWFLGSAGEEVWIATGDADAPFARISGRVYNDGCRSREAVIQGTYNSLPALIWVTANNAVVLAQGAPAKISTESVEEALRSSTNLRAWFFRFRRHDFYILTADQWTLVFDLTKETWSRWDTYDKPNWLPHVGVQTGSVVYAGSSNTNDIWELVDGTDDAGLNIVREVSGLVSNSGKPYSCSSIFIKMNSGWSPVYGFEPKLEFRWSEDQGTTWTNYFTISLGDRGQYAKDTIFRSLGLINRPGRIFEFRFSEKATFRLDYVTMNEI